MSKIYRKGIAIFIWSTSLIYLSFVPNQSDFSHIIVSYLLAFFSYLYLCSSVEPKALRRLVFIAILVRIATLFALPNLSDDFYRFLWDGRLWHMGIQPFTILPIDVDIHNDSIMTHLLENLNSRDKYSIYPSIPQLIFWVSSFDIFSASLSTFIFTMKLFHLSADICSIFIFYKLLKKWNLSTNKLLWFALNPLLIIELMHNVHHEGIVIFFILLSIYFLDDKKIILLGISMAFAIATKLLPLILCPLIFFYLKGRERWLFTIFTICFFLVITIPLISDYSVLQNILSSTELYVREFEFNASIYYILRELGYILKGFNLIHIIGPMLWTIVFVVIFLISLFRTNRMNHTAEVIPYLLAALLSFLICSPTVHPWYISLLIPLGLLSNYQFPIWWSLFIFFTYINYSFSEYHENLWVVTIEYFILFLIIWKEGLFKLINEKTNYQIR